VTQKGAPEEPLKEKTAENPKKTSKHQIKKKTTKA
jgi:hypothetical protein